MADKLTDFTGRSTRAPYELDLGDGTVMSVPHPTNAAWREATAADDMTGFLTSLGVDPAIAGRVGDALGDSDFGTESKLVTRMAEHFGKGN